jgi:hypothetical protein
VWCGAPPDAALLAPCCILMAAALLWASTALSALVWRSGPSEPDADEALQIFVLAAMLIAIAHSVPDVMALVLTVMMAAHAVLIALMTLLDAYGVVGTSRATARRAPPAQCSSDNAASRK